MSEDFDIEEELEFFAEPFLFEPEYTDGELREMEEEAAAAAAQPELRPGAADRRARASGTWWCRCTKCRAMPTEEESLCCVDWDAAVPAPERPDVSTDEGADGPRRCVTDNPEFPPLLTRGVLETVFHMPEVNWKKGSRPAGPNGTLSVDQCRAVACRVVLEWAWKGERLGQNDRKVLPSCVVSTIRESYPSATGRYAGFMEAQDAFELI